MITLPSWSRANDKWAWNLFKENFIQKDGRVIDWANNCTHSEAIGYTLFFALSYKDEQTFEKVYQWMHDNLLKNSYGLYGWKWGENESGSWGMLDMNNATDGDMWIAASLFLAHEQSGKVEYQREGLELLTAIHTQLIHRGDDGTLYLLPAKEGFIHGRMLTLNPSYLHLHLLRSFASYQQDGPWLKLYKDSRELLRKSRFGRFKIHPDWIHVDSDTGRVQIYPEQRNFSYDAIRVPLFLAYERKSFNAPELDDIISGYLQLGRVYNAVGTVTQPVDLHNDTLSLAEAPFGFQAVFACLAKKEQCVTYHRSIKKELTNGSKDYYSYSLLLFTDILYR